LHEELVEVELRDDLAVAAQQHLAHRTQRARPAGGGHGRQQRRLRRQRVRARPLGRPDDEHAQATQLAQRHVQAEVRVQAADLVAQVLLQVGGLHAGDIEAADLGQADLSVAVHLAAVVDVDRAPGADVHLVARAHQVVAGDGNVVGAAGQSMAFAEEVGAEHRQQAAGGAFDELLELARLRRHGRTLRRHGQVGRTIGGTIGGIGHAAGHSGRCGPRDAGGARLTGRARHTHRRGWHVARRVEGLRRCGLVGGARGQHAKGQDKQ
jgi:hypothetical protein